eukprot:gene37306-46033_t
MFKDRQLQCGYDNTTDGAFCGQTELGLMTKNGSGIFKAHVIEEFGTVGPPDVVSFKRLTSLILKDVLTVSEVFIDKLIKDVPHGQLTTFSVS